MAAVIRNLVRKGIRNHLQCDTHHGDHELLMQLLASKLMAEAASLALALVDDDREQLASKLADAHEVLRLIRVPFEMTAATVNEAILDKKAKLGCLTLQYTTLPARKGYRVVNLGNGIVFEVADKELRDVEP